MTDTACTPSACIECGKPARLAIGADDVYAAHCSNECAIATWNREQAEGRITCVGDLTVAKIDEALATTGIDVEELLA